MSHMHDGTAERSTRQPPTGLARRRARLSDEQTARRTLDAAAAMVSRTGLTVSLEHLGFEDVIREAGVARSAVYRRWPYKDLFFSDLLRELARGVRLDDAFDDESRAALVRQTAAEHAGSLGTPEGRNALAVALVRSGALLDFDAIRGSTDWRTYMALHATFLSLDDGDLRDDVRRSLAGCERGYLARVARSYEEMSHLIAYRLRPELGAGYDDLAVALSAAMRGLVIMSMSMPETVRGDAGASPVATAILGIVLGFLEPDPTIEWDDARVERLSATIGGALR